MTDTTDSLAAAFVSVLGAENLSLNMPELDAGLPSFFLCMSAALILLLRRENELMAAP